MKLYQRKPIMRAWRVSAIRRLAYAKRLPKSWALEKVREMFPSGSHDYLVHDWYRDFSYFWEKEDSAQAA